MGSYASSIQNSLQESLDHTCVLQPADRKRVADRLIAWLKQTRLKDQDMLDPQVYAARMSRQEIGIRGMAENISVEFVFGVGYQLEILPSGMTTYYSLRYGSNWFDGMSNLDEYILAAALNRQM